MKVFFRLILFFALTGISIGAKAQQQATDSLVKVLQTNQVMDTNLVNTLNQLSSYLTRSYPDSARAYAREGVQLAQRLNFVKGEALVYRTLGITYYTQHSLDSALFFFDRALEAFEKMGSEMGIAYIKSAKGSVYFVDAQYELAIQNFIEAKDNFEQNNRVSSVGLMYNNIANIYFTQKLYDKALEYYQNSLDILDVDIPDHQKLLVSVYSNVGEIYNTLGNYEEALKYAELGIPIAKEFQQIDDLSYLNNTIGDVYRETGENEKAVEHYRSAIEYNERLGNERQNLFIKKNMADSKEKLAEYEDAREYLNEVLTGLEQYSGMDQLESDALWLLAQTERKLGNTDIAYGYLEAATHLADSLTREEMGLKISELETKYETEKKEAQIQLLEKETEVANLRAFIIGIAGVVLIVLISFGFWQYYRRKAEEKRIKMESIKKELQQFGMIIAEKNNFISKFREDLEEVRKHVKTLEGRKEITSLVDQIHHSANLVEDEEELFTKIERVNAGFFMKLRSQTGSLTPQDERLATLVHMDLSNKDIANILHIEPKSVKQAKRRLKKKLQLEAEADLQEYLKSMAA